jgi:hypothetical protein
MFVTKVGHAVVLKRKITPSHGLYSAGEAMSPEVGGEGFVE